MRKEEDCFVNHPVLEEIWRTSEEYLLDKEEIALPGAGHQMVEKHGNASGIWKQKWDCKKRQEARPECEGPSMPLCL